MSGAEAPIFAAVISAAASGISTHTQLAAARSAERRRKDQQDKLMAEQARRDEQSKIDEQRNIDRSKKKTSASVAGGRADTILTSPLGVVEDNKAATKTLIGG